MSQMEKKVEMREGEGQGSRNERQLRELWEYLEGSQRGQQLLALIAGKVPLSDQAVIRFFPEGHGPDKPVQEWKITGAVEIVKDVKRETRSPYDIYWVRGQSVAMPIVAIWHGYVQAWEQISVEDAIRLGYDAIKLAKGLDQFISRKAGVFHSAEKTCYRGMGSLDQIFANNR